MTSLLDRPLALAARFRLNEAGPVLTLAALSCLAWLFVWMAGEVQEGATASLDRAILVALRRPDDLSVPIGPGWLREAARDITALGGNTILMLVSVSVVVYLAMVRKRGAAVFVAVSVGGATALCSLLKLGFARPRPDLVPHGMEVFSPSFPSSHAMLSAATYLTLGVMLARLEPRRPAKAFLVALALVLTILIGLSRLYLGVHWPSDVLAGWCGGAAWALACWFVALQLQRRGNIERATEGAEPASA